MQNNKITLYAFSIIEVMIGIFVFSLGLVAIFALLTSSLNVNELNKNSIIAGQLAREQIELVRNIRDTNYKKLKVWNQHDPDETLNVSDRSDANKVFFPDNYYFVENNYSTWKVEVNNLGTSISEWLSDLNNMKTEYGLCFDSFNRYVSCWVTASEDTKFFKYLKFEEAEDDLGNPINNAYVITSKVIWYKRGYHELEIKTIITDWRRI